MPRTKYGANTMLSYAGWGTADLDDIVQSSVTTLQTNFFAYYRANASTVITIPSRITQLATNSFFSACQNQRCTFKIDYINNGTEGMENLNTISSHADRKNYWNFSVPNSTINWYITTYAAQMSTYSWTFTSY